MGFGAFNPWPFRFGGGKRECEVIYDTLSDAYGKVLDMSEGEFADIETHAEAKVLSGAWIAGQRLRNQAVPSTMVEALPDWERITKLRPSGSDSDDERRAELSGKLRGLFNNAEHDIRDACAEVMGALFVDLHFVSESATMTYWPGVAPGPQDMPWASSRCLALVEVTRGTLTDQEYSRRVGKLSRMLDDMLPSWMGFGVFRHDTLSGVSGFFLDESMLDEVGL